VLQGSQLGAALMLTPIVAFTVAHHGLRDSMLWMVLSVFLTLKYRRAPPPSAAEAAGPLAAAGRSARGPTSAHAG
jgi:hypothetical protein